MAKLKNDGKGATSGFGEVDNAAIPPGPVYPDPGARLDTDSDWVRRDLLYKTSLPRQKFN